jgi:Bardet-Biedl syndrome 5 protein
LILKDTKYGRALVVESSPSSGHYLLGFRIDPQERVEELFHRLEAKLLACDEHPYFGIEIVEQEQAIPVITTIMHLIHQTIHMV